MKPRPAFLACFLLAVASAGAADQPWVEARSAHFTVYSDAGEKEARRVAVRFEQFRRAIGELWGAGTRLDPGRPVIIYAMRDEGSLKSIVPPKQPTGVVGQFFESADLHLILMRIDYKPFDEVPGMRQSIPPSPYLLYQHEYVHVLTNLNYEGVPLCIDEGLAEFWGNLTVRDDQAILGALIPVSLYILRDRPLVPVSDLLKLDRGSPEMKNDGQRSLVYAQSWAFIHYLLTSPNTDRKQRFDAFMALLKKGVGAIDAAKQAFGDLSALNEDFRRPRAYQQLSFPGDFAVADRDVVVRGLAPAEALALQGQSLARLGDTARAAERLGAALKLDPASAVAHEGLALVAVGENKNDVIVAESEKAIAADPKRMLPHYLAGFGLMRGTPSSDDAKRARAHLDAALALRSDFSPSRAWAARAHAETGDADKALDLARGAVDLDPSVVFYRLVVAQILERQHKTAEARDEATRAWAWARTEEDRRSVREFLESLGKED